MADEDIKEELSHVINENSNTISRLKGELKTWKETSHLNVNQLEETVNDREE